jgi:hypothetical protein
MALGIDELKKEYEEVKADFDEEIADKWPRVKALMRNRYVIAGLSALGGFTIGVMVA